MHGGDIRQFELFAPIYDLLVPGVGVKAVATAIEDAPRPVNRLLDVGGGTGRGSRAIDVPERIVVDPARGMLTRARRQGLATVRGDGSRLPIADGAVDAVVITDALHHIGDQRGALEETYRVLRPGGIVLVQEFDPTTIPGRALAVGERLASFDSEFHTSTAIEHTLDAIGFEASTLDAGFQYLVAGVRPR